MPSSSIARVLIEVNDRVVEIVLAEGALVHSKLCRTHVFPPPQRPGEDILVGRPMRVRRRIRH